MLQHISSHIISCPDCLVVQKLQVKNCIVWFWLRGHKLTAGARIHSVNDVNSPEHRVPLILQLWHKLPNHDSRDKIKPIKAPKKRNIMILLSWIQSSNKPHIILPKGQFRMYLCPKILVDKYTVNSLIFNDRTLRDWGLNSEIYHHILCLGQS